MANPIVTITMENGDVMKAELYPEIAPITVENFVNLVKDGFYDGLTFHRIINGFMIQGGCPLGTGTGGPGHTIKGEFSQNGVINNLKHTPCAVSYTHLDVYKRQVVISTHSDLCYIYISVAHCDCCKVFLLSSFTSCLELSDCT